MLFWHESREGIERGLIRIWAGFWWPYRVRNWGSQTSTPLHQLSQLWTLPQEDRNLSYMWPRKPSILVKTAYSLRRLAEATKMFPDIAKCIPEHKIITSWKSLSFLWIFVLILLFSFLLKTTGDTSILLVILFFLTQMSVLCITSMFYYF